MREYSKEWKESVGKWVQKHEEGWRIHYFMYDTEYSVGRYFTRKEAISTLKNEGR